MNDSIEKGNMLPVAAATMQREEKRKEILANFTSRPSDILISTVQKAGTTWLQQILYQLVSGGDTEFNSIEQVVPWLDWPSESKNTTEIIDVFNSLSDPRIFKSHCFYEDTLTFKGVRFILCSRDPRDVCVSNYYHFINLTDEAKHILKVPEDTSFDVFFERWMKMGLWFNHVSSWWPKHDDVLWLRYELMKRDLPSAVDSIIDFLKWGVSNEIRDRVIQHSSFEWMKNNEEKFQLHLDNGQLLVNSNSFLRKGEIGDYKNILSIQQQDRIIKRARESLSADCLAFHGLE